MPEGLGPRAQPIYDDVRARILSGEYPVGSQITPHREMAADYGVALMTVRQVLIQLEEDGLVVREHGRGTFVRPRESLAVLTVDDDPRVRALLVAHVARFGYRAIEADGPSAGLAALERDGEIVLILSDVRMPDREDGVAFIRAVRRRWPRIPLAAVTSFPDDLAELHGSPECPVLILAKPIWSGQIEQVFDLALRRPATPVNGRAHPVSVS